MDTRSGPRQLTCGSCGASFGCSPEAGSGCWCFDIVISEEKLKDLRAKYSDCICPECLRKHLAEAAKAD